MDYKVCTTDYTITRFIVIYDKVLKFRTLVTCHKSLDKQADPDQTVLSGYLPVCFSEKHLLSSSPDNQHFFRTVREKCLKFKNIYLS